MNTLYMSRINKNNNAKNYQRINDDISFLAFLSLLQLQDLETENESIRKDLMDLQKAVVDDKDFMEQGLPHAGKSAKLLLGKLPLSPRVGSNSTQYSFLQNVYNSN